MPSETRTIFFEQDELADAVNAYRDPEGRPLSRGKLQSIDVGAPGGDRASLRYITEAGIVELGLTFFELTELLASRCGALGIPLPRKGRKRLVPADGGIAMIVRLSDKSGVAFEEEMTRIEALARIGGRVAFA